MKRRLFLSGSAAAALGLAGCGGGGGGTAAAGDIATGVSATSGPGQQSLASAMPKRVFSTCYNTWDTGSYAITDIPGTFNVINLFHAKPNGSPVGGSWDNVGDGSFMFEHYGDVPASDIQACRKRGQKVILTVGGAQAGFNFDARWKSQNFVASYRELYDSLGGFDGCEFNNFEASIGSSPAEMIYIGEQLKSIYGAEFSITAPPQPNSEQDMALMKAMADAGVLTWASPQYYDWDGFNAPGFISGRTRDWVELLGADKVMVGLSANYSNGPSLADCVREWDAIKAEHPDIRGMFSWSGQLHLEGGSQWADTMSARL